MKIAKYLDLKIADDFLNMLFVSPVMEKVELLNDTFVDKLKMHKVLIDKYKDIVPLLDLISVSLIKNSKLPIEMDDKAIMLFSIAALSVSSNNEGKFLKENDFKKEEYEVEIKSLLEELKLSGIGNNLVKNLSGIYDSIISMSKKIFDTKDIFSSLSEPNLLQSINLYIKKYKLSINDFSSDFEKLSDTIENVYVKTGKLDDFKNKLSQKTEKPVGDKVLSINEFNL